MNTHHPLTAYRSPRGRVVVYDGCGARIGGAEMLSRASRIVENAAWIDALPKEEDTMTQEDKIKQNENVKRKRRPRNHAARAEQLLSQVLEEVKLAILDLDEDPARAARRLDKVIVLGSGGDVLAWYREQVGL